MIESSNTDGCTRATLSALLGAASTELAKSSSTPNLDAEILLTDVLHVPRARLLAHPEWIVPNDAAQVFAQLIARRRAGEPVAYLTGEREFWSLRLKVTAATLIPRPETELLVEQGLLLTPPSAHGNILELGTGSGAVALALAHERPGCSITATDISTAALDVARQNADALSIHNVEFVCGDWFAPLCGRRFQTIVSNPPYVATGDPHLQAGDVCHEPAQALDGGADGLDAIRTIARQAHKYLEHDGALLLEHGLGQAAAVQSLMRAAGFPRVQSIADLAGIERICVSTLGAPQH